MFTNIKAKVTNYRATIKDTVRPLSRRRILFRLAAAARKNRLSWLSQMRYSVRRRRKIFG